MYLKTINLLIGLVWFISLNAQTISGRFTEMPNQHIQLVGFNGFSTTQLAAFTTDSLGFFSCEYPNSYTGAGLLVGPTKNKFVLLLSGENIVLKGSSLLATESITIVRGTENQLFEQYAQEHPRREQALSAWVYLEKIYALDSLFIHQNAPRTLIEAEKQRIAAEDVEFLNALPENSYAHWFLPLRKLVSAIPTIAQYRPTEIPETIAALRAIDYTDNRLYHSGILKDVLEGHFWLLENSDKPLDSVFLEMQTSIDVLLENLSPNEQRYNELTEYLFNLLEQRSLFKASEYLAVKILANNSCTVNANLEHQLEQYRKMKLGNTAPNILFDAACSAPGYSKQPLSLDALTSEYTVVVFGSSWCSTCVQELPKISTHYQQWKAQGVEVVFVSLDENQTLFESFTQIFPFISVCDFKKWESAPVKDYHVYATPTYYLLNKNREIIVRPKSIEQINAWVDWYLVKGNPLPAVNK